MLSDIGQANLAKTHIQKGFPETLGKPLGTPLSSYIAYLRIALII